MMTATAKHKFIIVLGHESSGTRLIADTVARATGFEYDDGESKTDAKGQLIDTFLTKTIHQWWRNPDSIRYDKSYITRRSLPHGGIDNTELKNRVPDDTTGRTFLDPLPLINGLRRAGYDIRIILTVRDRNVAIHSKCREHTFGDRDLATEEMDQAVAIMNTVLQQNQNDCFVCSYEALMTLGAPYIHTLYTFLGIESDYMPILNDGNAKYIKGYKGRGTGLSAKSLFDLQVGIVTRCDEHQWGGDLRALHSAKQGLEQLGVRTRMAQTSAQLTGCDFVFLSNTCIDQRQNAEVLLEAHIPFGLFGFHEDFPAYYPQSMGFTEYISLCLQGSSENGTRLQIEDLWEDPEVFRRYNHEIPNNILHNTSVMHAATVCVACCHREAETMRRDCPTCKTSVVFWNIPLLGQLDESDEFLGLTGLTKGSYILQVGRLETRKNQLATILATKDLDIPLVLIATKGYQHWYDLLVVNAAAKYRKAPTLLISEEYPSQVIGGNTRIIQMPGARRLSERCLQSAYQNCGLHVHPAFWETPGYTYLEAAKIGVPTVASEWGTLQDYCEFGGNDKFMGDRFTYVCPYNLPQLQQSVVQNFGRRVSKSFAHPIFDRTERDVGKDLLQSLITHAL